jgi:hypothetical protein
MAVHFQSWLFLADTSLSVEACNGQPEIGPWRSEKNRPSEI